MRTDKVISIIAVTLLGLSGCGSSDSEDSSSENTIKSNSVLSAQFLDSAVQGLAYNCQPSGEAGLTDVNGYFYYLPRDICTFSVGEMTIGSAQVTGMTTPRSLTTVEPNLTNILRLLQTLDNDTNPANGITLPTQLSGSVDLGTNFDVEIQNYLAQNNISNTVVTPEAARTHFEQSVPRIIDDTDFSDQSYTITHLLLNEPIIFNFNADHTFTNSRDESGTWSIQNNILTAAVSNSSLNIHYDLTLTTSTNMVFAQYGIASDGSRFGEQAINDATYTVSEGSTNGGTGSNDNNTTAKTLTDLGATLTNTTLTTQDILQTGLYSTKNYVLNTSAYNSISKLTQTSSYGEIKYTYDSQTQRFEQNIKHYVDRSVYITNGVWETTVDEQSITFNSDGDVVIDEDGNQLILTLKTYDINGISISSLNDATNENFISTQIPLTKTAFSADSKLYLYSVTSDSFTPYYELFYYETCSTDTQGSTTCSGSNSNNLGLIDINRFIEIHSTENNTSSGLSIETKLDAGLSNGFIKAWFAPNNTLVLKSDTNGSTFEGGTYKIKNVGLVTILVLTLPDSLARADGKPIYSEQYGTLRAGKYHLTSKIDENQFWFNETAAFDIFNFIEGYK